VLYSCGVPTVTVRRAKISHQGLCARGLATHVGNTGFCAREGGPVCLCAFVLLYYMNVFVYYYNNIIIGVYTTGRNSRTPAATETAEEGAHNIYVCASSI